MPSGKVLDSAFLRPLALSPSELARHLPLLPLSA